ncbi:MAG: 2-dehydropantoate 2-reductase [Beijerinckiaceae bacterium]
MKVIVVGAGAIGGWIAGALSGAGAQVALLARGAALNAVRADGLIVRNGSAARVHRIAASNDVASLPMPDAVIVTVKTYDFAAAATQISPALKPGTAVVTAMNGLPWWFLDGLKGPLDGASLDSIDPGGSAAIHLKQARRVAAVVHGSTRVAAPGAIEIGKLDRLILGEPDGGASDATQELARLIEASGCPAPVSAVIRTEIWSKLWGNASVNPISALTRMSSGQIMGDDLVADVTRDMMEEFKTIGAALGVPLEASVDDRMDVARKLGDFRTSMLNDVEAGKRLEVDELLGVVVELADRLGVDAPTSRLVYALARGLARRMA